MNVNPTAVALVAFAAVIGALLGSVLVGLAVGLGLVLFATFASPSKPVPPSRRRRR